MPSSPQEQAQSSALECQTTVAAPVTAETPATFRVGTLVYSTRGLVVLFCWMLFGDFCFTMMEGIVPTMVPLLLKDLPISNTTIAMVIGTLPNLITMIFTPIVSYRSDRYRSRWGRRIPYLFTYSPIVAGVVILTGFSTDIGTWIHRILSPYFESLSSTQVLFLTIATCSILFQFFNIFVYNIYYYLFNDVIPAQLLGRYYALFRVVGGASGIVFGRYVFGLLEYHMRAVFVVIGLVYLVAFMLMCANVREGEYPPPSPPPPRLRHSGWFMLKLSAVLTFVRECFSNPFYWPLYIGYAFNLLGGAGIGLFRTIFATKELKMSLNELGHAMSWGLVISLVMYYPLGWIADRIHPMRLLMIANFLMVGVYIGSALCVHSVETFVFWAWMHFAAQAVAVSSNAPLYPRIFPKSRFGQFSSAVSLLSATAVMIGNIALGWLVDASPSYTIMYWWSLWFGCLSLVFYIVFYHSWKRRGGARHFVPPV